MRGYNRYKIFQKGSNLNSVPIRILNFKRPKWDLSKLKIKRLKVVKNGQHAFFNFFKPFNTKKLLGFLKVSKCNPLYLNRWPTILKKSKKINKFKNL